MSSKPYTTPSLIDYGTSLDGIFDRLVQSMHVMTGLPFPSSDELRSLGISGTIFFRRYMMEPIRLDDSAYSHGSRAMEKFYLDFPEFRRGVN